jgi:hypothetical protein
MRRSRSVIGRRGSSRSGRFVRTIASIALTWMNVSPIVRGIRSLTSAMTVRAFIAAVSVASTPTPRLQKP